LAGVTVAAGDCDGNGKADIIVGTGAGAAPHVKVFSDSGNLLQSLLAFQPQASIAFNGVHVGATDFNGDGRADLLAGAGRGDAPVLECRDIMTQQLIDTRFAFVPSFKGGVNVGGVS